MISPMDRIAVFKGRLNSSAMQRSDRYRGPIGEWEIFSTLATLEAVPSILVQTTLFLGTF